MAQDDLLEKLYPDTDESDDAAQDAALQGLLDQIVPQEATRGLDLSGMLGAGEAPAATRAANLTSLLSQAGVKENLVRLLISKFKLPKALADLLAGAIIKDLPKKKTARKRKTSSSTAKTSKSKPKTTSKRKTSSKPKTTARKTTRKTTKKRRTTREGEIDLSVEN